MRHDYINKKKGLIFLDRILVASLEQDFNNDKRITITIPANDSLQVEIAKDKNGMIITNVFYIFDELK